MNWKRPVRFVVATATYSFILSLIYVTIIYKPALWIETTSSTQHGARQRLQSRWARKNDHPCIDSVKDKSLTVRPTGYAKHRGYIDILTGEPLRLSCSTCAVVSSSGHLLNASSGAEIDSAVCVFRMNNAPIRGYEPDVGTRTTVRSIAHVNLARSFERRDGARKELLQDSVTRSEYLLINWMNRVNVRKLQDREYRYAVLLAHLYPDVRFYAFTTEQMHYAEKVFRNETGLTRQQANTWLSTGWFTMLAAMDICDDITVYGMAYDDYCSNKSKGESGSIPYHYYEPDGMKECDYYNVSENRLNGGHLFITEKAVFERWAHKHRIRFRYPSWQPDEWSSDEPLDSPFMRKYRQLLIETNNTISSVRDYVKLEREANRRALAEKRVIELRRGNETYTIEKRQLMQKVLELMPGVRPIRRKDVFKADKSDKMQRKLELMLQKAKEEEEKQLERTKTRKQRKRKLRSLMDGKDSNENR